MSIFVAKPDSHGWMVSDYSQTPPSSRFGGTREECECVAAALNELARQQREKLVAGENQERLDSLTRWERGRDERLQALEKTLRALDGKKGD